MANKSNCCKDKVVGAYLGDGVSSTFSFDRVYGLLFQRKFKDDGTLNTLDLTQTDFKTYINSLIASDGDLESRLYPTGKLDDVQIPERTALGSETNSDGSTTLLNTGGIQSISIGYKGKRATFEKLRQFNNMDCSQWQTYAIDINGSILMFKSDESATVARGFDINMKSFDNMFTFANESNSAKTMASFELQRESTFDCAYGISSCDHAMVLDDFDPLHPGYIDIVSINTNDELVIAAYQSLGLARNPSPLSGIADANITVTPDNATPIAVTAVEANEQYTLTLASTLPATTDFVVEIKGFGRYGVRSASGTSLA